MTRFFVGWGVTRRFHARWNDITACLADSMFVRTALLARGSGLGLAIVARVTKRHNGRIEMRNRADGFEVRVTLSATRE